jgi:hypothetical protein
VQEAKFLCLALQSISDHAAESHRRIPPLVACDVPVAFSSSRMAEPDDLPDPATPERSIAWAAKEVLRRHLGPLFDRHLPSFLAKAIVERLRLSKWRLVKEPPNPTHSTFGPPTEPSED